jgi:hypothetical protein
VAASGLALYETAAGGELVPATDMGRVADRAAGPCASVRLPTGTEAEAGQTTKWFSGAAEREAGARQRHVAKVIG